MRGRPCWVIQTSGTTPEKTGTDGTSHLLVYRNSLGLATAGKSPEYTGFITDAGTWPANGGKGKAVL